MRATCRIRCADDDGWYAVVVVEVVVLMVDDEDVLCVWSVVISGLEELVGGERCAGQRSFKVLTC